MENTHRFSADKYEIHFNHIGKQPALSIPNNTFVYTFQFNFSRSTSPICPSLSLSLENRFYLHSEIDNKISRAPSSINPVLSCNINSIFSVVIFSQFSPLGRFLLFLRPTCLRCIWKVSFFGKFTYTCIGKSSTHREIYKINK